MERLILTSNLFAIVGAGVVTGLLFAFSNFALRALAELPARHGMFAMQRINETIINPVFLLFFLGTPVAAGITIAHEVIAASTNGWLVAGAILYWIGPLGITALRNVPLNNGLAQTLPEDAEEKWPEYRRKWQRWNHVRTYLGVASIGLMAYGLAASS